MEQLNQFNFTKQVVHCPKCGNTEFSERDCGPDSYDDDITYSSFVCNKCELWFDGWSSQWYEDVRYWQDVEDKQPYETQTQESQS